jgi:acetyl esterase/lipase
MSGVEIAGTDVVAETRALNATVERRLAAEPPTSTLPVDVVRRNRREGRGVFPAPVFLAQAADRLIPSRDGEIRLRVLRPEGRAAGVYLHLHGGGWTLGAADQQDTMLWDVVEETGLCAVSVDYRLAPEHPYPAGPDDCEDAALWLLRDGRRELETKERLAIGGESAGAHLAVTTLLRLRDGHGVDVRAAFAAANLVFGWYDLSRTPSRPSGDPDAMLPPATMQWCLDGYLPGVDAAARRTRPHSPLYEDLHDLPPALITVGTRDPLLDDSLALAEQWRAAGNSTKLGVWDEAPHGFTAFPIEAARRSLAEQHEFLRG